MESLQFPTEGSGALEPRPIDAAEDPDRMQIFYIADFVRTKWGQVVRRPDPVDAAPLPTAPPPKATVTRPELQLYVPDFDPFDPDDSWLTDSQPVEPVMLKLYEPSDEPEEVTEQGNQNTSAEDMAQAADADFFDQLGVNDFYGAD